MKWNLSDMIVPRTGPAPKADKLWCRPVARCVDLGVYWLLLYAVTYFIFHRNIQWRVAENFAYAWIIMLLLEPLFLEVFKTTPGKALFGIRVTCIAGDRFEMIELYARVLSILSRLFIPIYNVYKIVKSYKAYRKTGEIDWDEGIRYTIKGDFLGRRVAACALCMLIIAATITISPYAADMPKHRGDLTIEQFTENVNRYLSYHGIVNMRYEGAAGFVDASTFETRWRESWMPVSVRRETLKVDFTETNGFVTEVTLTMSNISELNVSDEYCNAVVFAIFYSYVGAQEGMDAVKMYLSGAHGRLRQSLKTMTDCESFNIAGVDVSMKLYGNFYKYKGFIKLEMQK